MAVQSSEVAPGTYPFALYRWTKHGVRIDEQLVAVADEPRLEDALFSLLEAADEADGPTYSDAGERDLLDARHHRRWSAAQADHIAENQQLVEHRIQSLTVSHRARCNAISDQMRRATNDKIRVMKGSELARANADFDRRITELQKATSSGDIRAIPVVFGTIAVKGEPEK